MEDKTKFAYNTPTPLIIRKKNFLVILLFVILAVSLVFLVFRRTISRQAGSKKVSTTSHTSQKPRPTVFTNPGLTNIGAPLTGTEKSVKLATINYVLTAQVTQVTRVKDQYLIALTTERLNLPDQLFTSTTRLQRLTAEGFTPATVGEIKANDTILLNAKYSLTGKQWLSIEVGLDTSKTATASSAH